MVTELKKEGFRVKFVNLRSISYLAKKYKARSNPTYVYVVRGEEVRRASGNMPLSIVRSMFRQPLL